MDKLIAEYVCALDRTQKFTPEQLSTAKYALMNILRSYTVTCDDNALTTTDIYNPPGYQEFFVDRIMAGLSSATVNQYKYEVDNFLRYARKPLDKICSEDISVYLYRKQQEGCSAVTVNNSRRCLSAFFQWLTNREFLAKNPMLNVSPIKVPYRIQPSLTDEQFEAVISAASSQRDRAIVAVLAGSGIRRAELVNLKKRDVDIRGKKFRVVGKGNKERTCFLTSRAKHELEIYLRGRNDNSEYLFVREHAPYDKLSAGALNYIVKTISDATGITVHPHTFRHYFADSAHALDIDSIDISRMLGHASVSTTQLYLQTNVDDLAIKHSRMR